MEKEEILSAIPQEDIMQNYFLEKIDIKKSYLNPFRSKENKDNTPGCRFYYNEKKVLIFKDFSHPELSGDCFKICGLANNNIGFEEILRIICRDFNLKWKMSSFKDLKEFGRRRVKIVEKKQEKVEKTQTMRFNILPSWPLSFLTFWTDLGLNASDLSKWKIKPLLNIIFSTVKDNHTSITVRNLQNEIAFLFEHETDGHTAYIPNKNKSSRSEFYKTVKSDHIIGLPHISYEDYTYVLGSFKDTVIVDKIGLNALGLQFEMPRITSFMKAKIENSCYNNPIIVFDCDVEGIRLAKLLSANTGWPYIILDEGKDPGEYAEKGILKSLEDELVWKTQTKDFYYEPK